MASSLNATAFFLTYSQTKLEKSQVETHVCQVNTKRYIIALEHHQNGGEHIHVLVEYAKKRNVSPMHFDLLGEHPNVKTWDRSCQYEQWITNHWTYCLKEDPSPKVQGDPPATKKRSRDEEAARCLKIARTEGVDAALKLYKETCPFEYVRNPNSCVNAFTLECNDQRKDPQPMTLEEFNLLPCQPSIPVEWRTLYLYGDTGCGKTQLARALLPEAPVIRHIDQLKGADLSKGVIFDDFDVAHWPPTSVIHLLDWDLASGINVKHGHVRIPCCTRKIFTHNNPLYCWFPEKMSEEQKAACQRRVNDIHVSAKLY